MDPEKSKVLGKRARMLACLIFLLWFVFLILGIGGNIQEVIAISMLYSGISMICARNAYNVEQATADGL